MSRLIIYITILVSAIAGTFVITARLSAEYEAQNKIIFLTDELYTYTKLLNESEIVTSRCYIFNLAESNKERIAEIVIWLNDREFKLSSLINTHIEIANKAISSYQEETTKIGSNEC